MRKSKKLLALLLSIVMVCSLLPTFAFAAKPAEAAASKTGTLTVPGGYEAADGFTDGGVYLITAEGKDYSNGSAQNTSSSNARFTNNSKSYGWNNSGLRLYRDKNWQNTYVCYKDGKFTTQTGLPSGTSAVQVIDKATGNVVNAMFQGKSYYVVNSDGTKVLKGNIGDDNNAKDVTAKTYGLTNSFSNNTATAVELDAKDSKIASANGACEWTAAASGSNGFVSLKNGSKYLRIGSGGLTLTDEIADNNYLKMNGSKLYSSDVNTKDQNTRFMTFAGDKFGGSNAEGNAAAIKLYKLADKNEADVYGMTATYSGSVVLPYVSTYNNADTAYSGDYTVKYSMNGTTWKTAAEAAALTTTFPVNAAANAYTVQVALFSGTTKKSEAVSASVTINPKPITVPTAASLTYNGTEQTAVAAAEEYTLSVDDKQTAVTISSDAAVVTAAGTYTDVVTAKLANTDTVKNYVWAGAEAGKETDDVKITVTVAQADVTVTADNKSITKGGTETLTAEVSGKPEKGVNVAYTLNVTKKDDDETVYSDMSVLPVGEYDIVVVPGTNANYNVTPAKGVLTVNPINTDSTTGASTLKLIGGTEDGKEIIEEAIVPGEDSTYVSLGSKTLTINVYDKADCKNGAVDELNAEEFQTTVDSHTYADGTYPALWVDLELVVNDVVIKNAKLNEKIPVFIPYANAVVGQPYTVLHWTGAAFDTLTGTGKVVGDVKGVEIMVDSFSPFIIVDTIKYWQVDFSVGEGYTFVYDTTAYGAENTKDYTFEFILAKDYSQPVIVDAANGYAELDLTLDDYSAEDYSVVKTEQLDGSIRYRVTLESVEEAHAFHVDSINKNYFVYYYANDGVGAPPAKKSYPAGTVDIDVNFAAANIPTKEGFDFVGWLCSIDNEVKKQADAPKFTMPEEDVTFTAQWQKWGEASYDLDGGVNSTPATTAAKRYAPGTANIAVAAKNTISKKGYTFVKWTDGTADYNSDGTGVFTMPTDYSDVVIKAVWLANDYTVTYNDNGATAGTAPTETTKNIGDTFIIKEAGDLTKTDSVFGGWFLDTVTIDGKYTAGEPVYQPGDSFTVEDKNVKFYALWDAAFTVTYNANYPTGLAAADKSGSVPADTNNPYGKNAAVTVLGNTGILAAKGYTLTAWNTEANGTGTTYAFGAQFNISANTILYGVWTADETYSVTYSNGTVKKYLAGAEVTVAPTPATPIPGDPFDKMTEQLGWTCADINDGALLKAGTKFTMPAKDIALTAEWAYKVNFVLGDPAVTLDGTAYNAIVYGSSTDVYKAYYGGRFGKTPENITLPADPTWTDHTFKGWLNSVDGKLYFVGDQFTMTDNTILTAQWDEIVKYSFTYDPNGATSGTAPTQVPVIGGAQVTIAAAGTMARTGYKFIGWNTEADGSGKTYQLGNKLIMPEENVILYAQWAKLYTVKFVKGTAFAEEPAAPAAQTDLVEGSVATIAEPAAVTFVKDSVTYYFNGWKNQKTGEMWYFGYDTVCADTADNTAVVTLVAQWATEKMYTVVFDDNLDDPLDDYVVINGASGGIYTIPGQVLANAKITDAMTPAFSRVDYILGEDSTYDIDWYLNENLTIPFDRTKTLEENDAANYAVASTLTLYAKWTPNYTQPTDVKVDAESLTTTGTYNTYYSDFIEAKHVINQYNSVRVYRNFHLLPKNADGTDSLLPTGLYLNARTGEVYGVPTAVGTFKFTVVMGNDAYKNTQGYTVWDPISEETEFTITIAPNTLSIDHNDLTYNKIYGDADPAALLYNDTNLTKSLSVMANVSAITLTDIDNSLTIDYSYVANNTTRTTNAATFTPADASTLKYAPDLAAPVVDDTKSDTLQAFFTRETGEDVGQYKLCMPVSNVTGAAVTAGAYTVVIPADFAAETMPIDHRIAAKYAFKINKATLEIGLTSYNPTKYYGENDPTFYVNGMTLSVANAENGVAATTDTKEIVVDFTGTGDAGFKDTITVELLRKLGEDYGDYQIYLSDEKITGKETTKTTAPAIDKADPLSNYTVVINDNIKKDNDANHNKLTIQNRDTTFTVTGNPFTYGTLKPGDALTGEHSGLADNANIKVVDTNTSVTLKSDLTKSTAGKLEVGSYGAGDVEFVMTNTAWVDDGTNTVSALTRGNYNVTCSFTVNAKALALKNNNKSVLVGSTVNEDTIKALFGLDGVVTGDVVAIDFADATFTVNDGTTELYTGTDLALALAEISTTAAKTYTITMTPAAVNKLTGADAGNYTLPAYGKEAKLTVYVPAPPAPAPITYKNCPKTAEKCLMSDYTDLTINAWYHDGIHFCLDNGLMNGVAETTFAPQGDITRGMIVVMLWRLDGQKYVDYAMTFEDVPAGQWYTEAVRWAASEKIVDGIDAEHFDPNAPITREQLATILYRYAKYKGQGFTGSWMFLLDFEDRADISSWADEAVHWCSMKGIVNGKDGNVFDPQGTATRAEAATMMQRFCETLEK